MASRRDAGVEGEGDVEVEVGVRLLLLLRPLEGVSPSWFSWNVDFLCFKGGRSVEVGFVDPPRSAAMVA